MNVKPVSRTLVVSTLAFFKAVYFLHCMKIDVLWSYTLEIGVKRIQKLKYEAAQKAYFFSYT